jgi:two-component system cell cycle response regulator
MKILIVEDHPPQLKLAHQVLSLDGHSVNDADAAEQVFGAILADRPDVILLDLGLPGMDGLTLARMLKADSATRDICIVAVTSYPDEFTRSDALAAGCEAYIRKPINTRELSGQLSAVAGLREEIA